MEFVGFSAPNRHVFDYIKLIVATILQREMSRNFFIVATMNCCDRDYAEGKQLTVFKLMIIVATMVVTMEKIF